MLTMNEIISPISLDEFLSFHRGQKHLLLPGDKQRFTSLFSWDDLNRVLFTNRFEYPRLRLIKNGEVIDSSMYLDQVADKRGGKYHKVSSAKLLQQLNVGKAMHILSIQEFSPALTDMCSKIGQQMNCDAEMTIHIGLKQSHGFDLHWDSHDVFVLQLQGRKHWRLFGFTEENPFRKGPSKKGGEPSDVIWEGDLREGDVLYIPRGYWHEVHAYDEPCMHISLGLYNPKLVDYFHWLTNLMYEFSYFRQDLPLFKNDPSEVEIEVMKQEISKLITRQTYKAYLDQFITEKKQNKFTFPNL
ncbi:MAG TPA: cupin domain-containing protein [Puia sp.]|nr:cupin domain-containing protein [Puia sp.]